MSSWNRIMECVPNFSEGRDHFKIEKIIDVFREKDGIRLLDYSNDEDHNRMVVTVIGEPEHLKAAILDSVGLAVGLIDLNKHQGQHPRMGAVDVIPFIPIKGCTMDEAIALSKEVGKQVAKLYNIPVFLYEKSASAPYRENLATIRKGEFEGMAEKIKQPEWKPDFGPAERHPTAGTVAIGARMPLIAYNINLGTNNLEIADNIAKKIRFIGGGLRYCKAMGVALKERGIVQVSINMTDYTHTALYRAFELVKIEARRYGVAIVGSEIIGLVPMDQKTYGLTMKLQVNVTPDISIQFYGSPFTSTAKFSNFKLMTDTKSHTYDDRFAAIDVSKSPQYNDLSTNSNFSFNEFRSNLVARWEYLPGSTLYFVWEHQMSERRNQYDSKWKTNLDHMFGLPTTNTFMPKSMQLLLLKMNHSYAIRCYMSV